MSLMTWLDVAGVGTTTASSSSSSSLSSSLFSSSSSPSSSSSSLSPLESLLGSAVTILSMICIGAAAARASLLAKPPSTVGSVVTTLNTVAFNVCMPALALHFLAVTDLRRLVYLKFGLVVFCTRTLLGIFAAAWTACRGGSAGDFVCMWMSTTWTNSVVLGLPLLTSLFGADAAVFTIIAVLPSLWTELPIVIALLTRAAARKQQLLAQQQLRDAEEEAPLLPSDPSDSSSLPPSSSSSSSSSSPSLTKVVALSLLKNPTVIAVVIGTVLGLTWPRRLPTIVYALLQLLGSPLVVIALLSLGAHTSESFTAVVRRGFTVRAWTLLVIKLLVSPALATGFVWLFGLHGVTARAAVICCAIATASSSFIIASAFGQGDELPPQILFGTVLMFGSLSLVLKAFNALPSIFD